MESVEARCGEEGGGKLTCQAYHLTPRTCTVLQPVGRVEEGHSCPHLSLEYAQDPQDNQGYAPTQIQYLAQIIVNNYYYFISYTMKVFFTIYYF